MPSYFLPVLFSILSYLRGQRNFLLHKRLKRRAYCEKAIEERQDDSETGRKGQAHCHYAEGRLGSKPGRRKKTPGR